MKNLFYIAAVFYLATSVSAWSEDQSAADGASSTPTNTQTQTRTQTDTQTQTATEPPTVRQEIDRGAIINPNFNKDLEGASNGEAN